MVLFFGLEKVRNHVDGFFAVHRSSDATIGKLQDSAKHIIP